ncbi:HlyD family secretion protein [Chthonobacter rhizosphaerae]|uniref:HlyD family secretion protein n=1 Tax=Chthonobacter rhizosphaerae TaxID=2735553 RepID=UPI0015EFA347|nr:HlyD family efflux transporter periplasmic adaptor subunit [Chthonobacter rhizosphaerae]
MRLLRVVFGLLLLVGGLYILVGEYFAGTSADATLNSRVTSVRAPIQGEVSLAVRAIGARIKRGELVADIADSRFDTARLIDLEHQRDETRIERERVASQTATITTARDGFLSQLAAYKEGRITQIEARAAEARAAEDAAEARLREAEGILGRSSDLSGRGVQTEASLERSQAAFDVARQERESARHRSNYIAVELASARKGVFLSDSSNDAPVSAQRARELDLRLAELDAERVRIDARLAEFERQIQAERVRINRLTSASLASSVDGLVWTFGVDDGEYANRGQELVRVADCSTLMVTASVSEALYDRLSIGDPVQFRLFGDHRIFGGTVIRLGGSGAASLYDNLAVAPSQEHLERFDVTVSVPDLAGQSDLVCAIGRTGRVIFTAGPIAKMRRFLARYGI